MFGLTLIICKILLRCLPLAVMTITCYHGHTYSYEPENKVGREETLLIDWDLKDRTQGINAIGNIYTRLSAKTQAKPSALFTNWRLMENTISAWDR